MVIDTFLYVTEIPSGAAQASPWQMKSAETIQMSQNSLRGWRVVGSGPLLYVNDAGMTPHPSTSRPAVLRSELRLVTTDAKYALHGSYFVDKVLIHALRQGDLFHITRTGCGHVGVSAIRQGKLIFAVGAVGSVPLGSDITVRTPDLLQKAEALLRSRDPEFEFDQHPVEVCVGNSLKIWYRGLVRMGGYHVWVEHGFIPGDPGTAESLSITLDEVCDWVAGSASAQLLALP